MQHGPADQDDGAGAAAQGRFHRARRARGPHLLRLAGVYNILQPEIAHELKLRKVRNIESLKPQLIATGNIGCMMQIGTATGLPIVHTVELLDWASGGPVPEPLLGSGLEHAMTPVAVAAE